MAYMPPEAVIKFYPIKSLSGQLGVNGFLKGLIKRICSIARADP
jgi:hypothetical protein